MYGAPTVRCRERSGYPCDVIVHLDSPHCGDPAHFTGANGGVPVRRQRARVVPLIVDEDYDLVEYTADLDPVSFDPRRVQLSRGAIAAWGRHPVELREKLKEALLRGGYWRTASGGHLLEIGRHQILLSEDGRCCDTYTFLPQPTEPAYGGPIDTLVPPAWDQDDVGLAPHVIRQFAGRHRVSEDDAAEELFDLLDHAVERGKHIRDNRGYHRLSADGFTLIISPDDSTITSYHTLHAERTPSEVRNKVPSRFGRRKMRTPEEWAAWHEERDRAVSEVPAELWVPTAAISDHFDPSRTRITTAVADPARPDRREVLDSVREALRQAAAAGQWNSAEDGHHFLDHEGRRWTISADGRGVLGCEPAWPQSDTVPT
jgi:hypothetical protein